MTDIHKSFKTLPIKELCDWYGSVDDFRGEPTIWAGLFCSPGHLVCEYHSICVRHSYGKTELTEIT